MLGMPVKAHQQEEEEQRDRRQRRLRKAKSQQGVLEPQVQGRQSSIPRLPRSPLKLEKEMHSKSHRRWSQPIADVPSGTADAAAAAGSSWSEEASDSAWEDCQREESFQAPKFVIVPETETGNTYSLSRLSYEDPGRRQMERHLANLADDEEGERMRRPSRRRLRGRVTSEETRGGSQDETVEMVEEGVRERWDCWSRRSYSDALAAADERRCVEDSPLWPERQLPPGNGRWRQRRQADEDEAVAVYECQSQSECTEDQHSEVSCRGKHHRRQHSANVSDGEGPTDHRTFSAVSSEQQEGTPDGPFVTSSTERHYRRTHRDAADLHYERRRWQQQDYQNHRKALRQQRQLEYYRDLRHRLKQLQSQQEYAEILEPPRGFKRSDYSGEAENDEAFFQQQQAQQHRQLRPVSRHRNEAKHCRDERPQVLEGDKMSLGGNTVVYEAASLQSAPNGDVETAVGSWEENFDSASRTATAAQETGDCCSQSTPPFPSYFPSLLKQQKTNRKRLLWRSTSASRGTQTAAGAAASASATAAASGPSSLAKEVFSFRTTRGGSWEDTWQQLQEWQQLQQWQHAKGMGGEPGRWRHLHPHSSVEQHLQEQMQRGPFQRLASHSDPVNLTRASRPASSQVLENAGRNTSSCRHVRQPEEPAECTVALKAAAAPASDGVSGEPERAPDASPPEPIVAKKDSRCPGTAASSTVAQIPAELVPDSASLHASLGVDSATMSLGRQEPSGQEAAGDISESFAASSVAEAVAETAARHGDREASIVVATAGAGQLPTRVVGWQQILNSKPQQPQPQHILNAAQVAAEAQAAASRVEAAGKTALHTASAAREKAAAPPLRSSTSNCSSARKSPAMAFPRQASAKLPPISAHVVASRPGITKGGSESNKTTGAGKVSSTQAPPPRQETRAADEATDAQGIAKKTASAGAEGVTGAEETTQAVGRAARQAPPTRAADGLLEEAHQALTAKQHQHSCMQSKQNDQGGSSSSGFHKGGSSRSDLEGRRDPHQATAASLEQTEDPSEGTRASILPPSEVSCNSSGNWSYDSDRRRSLPRLLHLQLRQLQNEEKQRLGSMNYFRHKQQLLERTSKGVEARRATADAVAVEKLKRQIASKSPIFFSPHNAAATAEVSCFCFRCHRRSALGQQFNLPTANTAQTPPTDRVQHL